MSSQRSYRMSLSTRTLSQMSFIKTRNSNGPETPLLIIPLLTGTALDKEEFILTI